MVSVMWRVRDSRVATDSGQYEIKDTTQTDYQRPQESSQLLVLILQILEDDHLPSATIN